MSYALKKGTTSKILLVYALDASDMRSGKTGFELTDSGLERRLHSRRRSPSAADTSRRREAGRTSSRKLC